MKTIARFSEYLSQAILLEAATAPKPGLVTRLGNGAHQDMSLMTFMMSSVVVAEAFQQIFALGQRFSGSAPELFAAVRQQGIPAEKKLLQVTKNVNTQRGILFAGGVLAAAGGSLSRGQNAPDAAAICDFVREMTAGLVERELRQRCPSAAITYGEKLYQKYHITGIRGEVERGFSSVRTIGLPAMQAAFAAGRSINDALVHALLSLMTVVEDSNVIWRTDYETLCQLQKRAAAVLQLGSIFSDQGWQAIACLDKDCIARRISPGGSADLLSVTTALYLLEQAEFPGKIQ